MSILESVRERRKRLLARLTERPVLPVPILGGAVPARIVKQAFVEPYVERPELRGILRGLPSFAYGTAYGETAGQWYRVTYSKSLSGAVPVCVARGRTGAIITKAIDRIGDISIKTVSRPADVSVREISRITTTESELRARVRERCGDWGVLNWFRDRFAEVVAKVLKFVWDILVQPQIDKVRDNINSIIVDFNDKVNRSLSRLVDAVNVTVKDANYKINVQTDKIQDRVNARINDLYSMWGIPSNMAVTPVHTRNETDSGFDFQSYGKTTVHYIAIGGR